YGSFARHQSIRRRSARWHRKYSWRCRGRNRARCGGNIRGGLGFFHLPGRHCVRAAHYNLALSPHWHLWACTDREGLSQALGRRASMKYRHIKKWILLAGIVLSAVASHFSGAINSYYLQIVIFIGINITLAVSLNLINGYTGQFSLGHAGFMAIGAYVSAYLSTEHSTAFFKAFGTNFFSIALLFIGVLIAGGLVASVAGLIV